MKGHGRWKLFLRGIQKKMNCKVDIGKIKNSINEYVFDGQFSGLYDLAFIKENYIKLIKANPRVIAWAGEGDQIVFCPICHQEWDSNFLKKKVLRIDYVSYNCKKRSQFESVCALLNNADLVYLRLSMNHPLITLLKDHSLGFREYAEKIMLRLAINEAEEQHVFKSIIPFSELQIPDKAEQLSRIVGESFMLSRFSRDKKFPEGFSKRIYQLSVRSYLPGQKDVLCSVRDEKIGGFIVISDTIGSPMETFRCGFVEMIAVDSSGKRQSVGKELIQSAARLLLLRNIHTLHANTDSQNFGAINFFQAIGFRQFNLIREYHWWRK